MFGYNNIKINENGNLSISECDCVELAKKYGTPLYIMDEAEIRRRCREISDNHIKKYKGFAVYASKAFLNKEMCRIIHSEGLGIDVVSGGELYTAQSSGFPMENVIFHGNNKSIEELNMAVDFGVGRIVIDNFNEIENLKEIVRRKNKKTGVMIRVSPGVDGHTHEYIKTGQVDSKFGFPIFDGSAMRAVEEIIAEPYFNLRGIHSHVGSQLFENDVYIKCIKIMARFYKDIYNEFKIHLDEINVGGGFGIYYSKGDVRRNINFYTDLINNTIENEFKAWGLNKPLVIIEPGRWIVGEAGLTLYTIGAIKDIKGVRKYVSVDGGMTDNIRPSLYGAEYSAAIVNKKYSDKNEVVTIAGKCCESGDILIKNIELPVVAPGDILAVFSTGAYNYSMSNNYNRNLKPAVVMVNNGEGRMIIKRETYEDLLRNDI